MAAPTTSELSGSILGQIEAHLEQTVPLLPKAFLRILAKVLAGVVSLLYRYIAFVGLQQFIRTASFKETTFNGETFVPLIEWGRQIGLGDPYDAVRAELTIEITVLSTGGTLSSGHQLLCKETGVVYLVVADTALSAGTMQIAVRAATDGDIGNLDVGDTLLFAKTPASIATEATVVATTKYGADAEKEQDYRQRCIEHEQARPQGGAGSDYREWASGATGVKRVYPYRGAPGYVDVYVEATADVDPDGIPDATTLTAAYNAIELTVDGLASNRPVNARINCVPITRLEFTVYVIGLSGDIDGKAQDAIEIGVDEFVRSREPYILGLSVLPRRDHVTQGEVAGVATEIALGYGCTINRVDMYLGGLITPGRQLDAGELAKATCVFV